MKNTCSNTTIYEFLECKFRSNYDILAEKDSEKPVSKEVFELIYEQFISLSGSKEYSNLLNELNELIRLNNLVLSTRAALAVLTYKFDKEQIEILKKNGFNAQYDVSDVDSYIKDLNAAWSLLKGVEIKIQIQIKRIEELQKKNKNAPEQTESDFMEGLTNVSKFMGFRIGIKETTLAEYAGYIKLNNSQAQKHGK